MANDDADNRRKHSRTAMSLLVQYRFNSVEDFLAEYAVNLSPGGMFIKTAEPRDLGSLIHMQFSLKDGSKLIEGMGRVVRVISPGDLSGDPGMAVEFVDFDDESNALIRQLCQTRRKKRPL